MDNGLLQKAINAISRHSMGRITELMGAAPKFEIRGGYKHRDQYVYYDDTPGEDEYQREVYLRAALLMEQEHAKTVYDVEAPISSSIFLGSLIRPDSMYRRHWTFCGALILTANGSLLHSMIARILLPMSSSVLT
jgi:hypothetical protein